MGVSARALSAGKAVLELGLIGSKEVDRALRMLQKKTAEIGASFTKIGASFAAAGGVITGALGAAAKSFAVSGDELSKLRDKTQIAVESLSELRYAAGQSGTDISVLAKGLREMQDRGLDPRTFDQTLDRIAAIKDPVKRAQEAFEIFGKRTGSELLPLLGGLESLRQRARDLGLVMSTEDATAATNLGDAFDDVHNQFKRLIDVVGAAIAGPLTKFFLESTKIGKFVIDWANRNRELIATIGAVGVALTAAGTALAAFGGALTLAVASVGALTTAAAAITPTIAGFTLAIGAAAAALAGIAIDSGAAGKALDILKRKFSEAATGAEALYRAWKAAEAFKNGTFYIGGRAIHAPIPSDSPAPAAPAAPAVAAAAVDPNRNNPFADTARDDFALSGIRWGMRAAESLKKELAAKQKQLGEALAAAAALGLTKARVAPAMKAAKVATSAISYGMTPEAVFDTTFAKQAFGGEGIQREQLGELKGIHRVLKSQSHGLPVV